MNRGWNLILSIPMAWALATVAPAHGADLVEVWSGTLTIGGQDTPLGSITAERGYNSTGGRYGALAPNQFTVGDETITIERIVQRRYRDPSRTLLRFHTTSQVPRGTVLTLGTTEYRVAAPRSRLNWSVSGLPWRDRIGDTLSAKLEVPPEAHYGTVKVSFGEALYRASEGGQDAVVEVHLDRVPGREITLPINVEYRGGSTAGEVVVPTSLTFGAQERVQTFNVRARLDDPEEPGEWLILSFTGLPQGVQRGSRKTTRIDIIDAWYDLWIDREIRVMESAGKLTFHTHGQSRHRYDRKPRDYEDSAHVLLTRAGSATEGHDYTRKSLTVSEVAWRYSENCECSRFDHPTEVQLVDDDTVELDEQFTVTLLRNGRDRADLQNTVLTVTIVDDDNTRTPILTIEPVSTEVIEDRGAGFRIRSNVALPASTEVRVSVSETGSMLTQTGQRRFTLPRGATSHVIHLPTRDDRVSEGESMVKVKLLSSPVSVSLDNNRGYRIGTVAAATVRVMDNDANTAVRPGRPTNLAAVAGNGAATLTWKAPEHTGSSAISRYEIRRQSSSSTTGWTSAGRETRTVARGLENGAFHVFWVRAVNAQGASEASEPQGATPMEATGTATPTAPRLLSAIGYDAKARLTWVAPLKDGGSRLTRYEYRIDGAGSWRSTGSTGTVYEVTGLENEREYGFEVRAVNAAGRAGPSTSRVRATPDSGTDLLTGQILKAPANHGGRKVPFRVRVKFSAPLRNSYRDFARGMAKATGGSVTEARRVQGETRSTVWDVTIQPKGTAPVEFAIEGSRVSCSGLVACSTSGKALSHAIRKTVDGPRGLRIADGAGHEGTDTTIEFMVTLTESSDNAVTVDWTTIDGEARAGSDYTRAGGRLKFQPGETARTVSVTLRDDAVDEGTERFYVVLSNPVGAIVADSTATGRITNSDPLQKAWVSRFGRSAASVVAEAVAKRAEGGGRVHVSAGTFSLMPRPVPREAPPREEPGWVSTGELPRQGSFLARSGTQDESATWTAWGQIGIDEFKGREDRLRLNADLKHALAGADVSGERWLAGVAVALTRGKGPYSFDASGGKVEGSLTGVYPYAHFSLSEDIGVWGVAGGASGEIDVHQDDGQSTHTADLDLVMGALGGRAAVDGATHGWPFDLGVRSEVLWARTSSEKAPGLASARGEVTRLRVALEASRAFSLDEDAWFSPGLEVALRHDGGDAERGAGFEVAARAEWSSPGVSLEGTVRTLIAHHASGAEHWGASGSLRLDPGAAGRGIAFTMTPAWGLGGNGSDRIWSRSWDNIDNEDLRHASLRSELGYGHGLGSGRGIVTPYIGMDIHGDDEKTFRIGSRWTLRSGARLGAEGSRRTGTSGRGEGHALMFHGSVSW